MIACLVMSLFFKVFLGMLYARMIKEADNMATTDNKLLKQCKIKFSNCYELTRAQRSSRSDPSSLSPG